MFGVKHEISGLNCGVQKIIIDPRNLVATATLKKFENTMILTKKGRSTKFFFGHLISSQIALNLGVRKIIMERKNLMPELTFEKFENAMISTEKGWNS